MKRELPVPVIRILIVLLLTASILAGCSFFRKSPYFMDEHSLYYTGHVFRDGPAEGPIIVVLYAEKDKKYTVLSHDMVPTEGTYYLIAGDGPSDRGILAFEDANNNFIYDAGEKIAYLKRTPENARSGRDQGTWGDIRVPASGGKAPGFIIDLSRHPIAGAVNEKWSSRVGSVVSIDDSRFDSKNGVTGNKDPYTFLRKYGPALYMLEPYDPNRKVVLLVHGVKGTPADFKEIIPRLDRKRFQAWVYFWPTGMPINFSAGFLEMSLQEMKEDYEFKEMDIITHSMGGLMSRAAINMSIATDPLPVGRFITLSTPWDGHAGAKLGVTMSPVVIPSWEDMVPGSYFLDHLFDASLPASTKHVLLFSYKGVNLFTPGNDDGSVSIESMLFYKAQEGAFLVNGFNTDHSSMLTEERVIMTINSQMKER